MYHSPGQLLTISTYHMQDPSSRPTLDKIMFIIIVLGVLIGQLIAAKIF